MDCKNRVYISYDCYGPNNESLDWLKGFLKILEKLLGRLYSNFDGIITSSELRDGGIDYSVLDSCHALIVFLLFDNSSDEWKNEVKKLIDINPHKTVLVKFGDVDVPEGLTIDITRHISFKGIDTANENFMSKSFYSDGALNVFMPKIFDLAFEIHSKTAKDYSEVQEGSQKKVYLAHVSEDQLENRNIIKRELQEYGYQVVPGSELPDTKQEFEAAVKEILNGCILSIHIFGDEYGEMLDDEAISKIEFENIIAAMYFEDIGSEKKFSRIIWMPQDMNLIDEKQRARLEQLKINPILLSGAEVFQTPLEYLKSFIRIKLDELSEDKTSDVADDSLKESVYIISEKEDIDNNSELITKIEELGFEAILPDFSSTDLNPFRVHKEKLVKSDNVLILSLNDNIFWLQSKIKDIVKAPGFGRENDFNVKAVLTSAVNPAVLNFAEQNGMLTLTLNNSVVDSLAPFFEQLKS